MSWSVAEYCRTFRVFEKYGGVLQSITEFRRLLLDIEKSG